MSARIQLEQLFAGFLHTQKAVIAASRWEAMQGISRFLSAQHHNRAIDVAQVHGFPEQGFGCGQRFRCSTNFQRLEDDARNFDALLLSSVEDSPQAEVLFGSGEDEEMMFFDFVHAVLQRQPYSAIVVDVTATLGLWSPFQWPPSVRGDPNGIPFLPPNVLVVADLQPLMFGGRCEGAVIGGWEYPVAEIRKLCPTFPDRVLERRVRMDDLNMYRDQLKDRFVDAKTFASILNMIPNARVGHPSRRATRLDSSVLWVTLPAATRDRQIQAELAALRSFGVTVGSQFGGWNMVTRAYTEQDRHASGDRPGIRIAMGLSCPRPLAAHLETMVYRLANPPPP